MRFARRTPAWAGPLVERGIALGRQRRVQRLVALLLLGLAFATVGFLIVQHWDQLRAAPWRLEPGRLIAGLLLQATAIGIDALIWVDISHRLGSSWDPRRDVRVYAYSLLAKRLPGAIWHVVGRAAYYAESGLGRRVGVMGSAIEAGLLVLSGVALSFAFFPDLQPYGLIAALLLVLLSPQLFRPIMRVLLGGPAAWLPTPGRLYFWLALYAVAWLVGCLGAFLQFDALYPLDPSLLPHLVWAATSSIVASAVVVVVPGGLGLRELGLTALMSEVMPAGVAAALAIAYRLAIASIEVLWSLGAVALLRPRPTEASSRA
jgi:uncharacterized membrane protein YbhN (UPF0104 family)